MPLESHAAACHALRHMVKSEPRAIKVLLGRAIAELEKIADLAESAGFEMSPVSHESIHPYDDDCEVSGTVKIPGGLR